MVFERCAGTMLPVRLSYTNLIGQVCYVQEISCRYLRRCGDTAFILRTTGFESGSNCGRS